MSWRLTVPWIEAGWRSRIGAELLLLRVLSAIAMLPRRWVMPSSAMLLLLLPSLRMTLPMLRRLVMMLHPWLSRSKPIMMVRPSLPLPLPVRLLRLLLPHRLLHRHPRAKHRPHTLPTPLELRNLPRARLREQGLRVGILWRGCWTNGRGSGTRAGTVLHTAAGEVLLVRVMVVVPCIVEGVGTLWEGEGGCGWAIG